MPPDRVHEALTVGRMRNVGHSLTAAERRQVAETVTGRPLGDDRPGSPRSMPNRCSSAGPMNPAATRPGPDAAQLPGLKLRWAFASPGSTSLAAAPTVAGGRVFFATDTGFVYALDERTGCVLWGFYAEAGVRAAVTVGAAVTAGGPRQAVVFGDLRANVYALAPDTGELIWMDGAAQTVTSRIVSPPLLIAGLVLTPVSSLPGPGGETGALLAMTAEDGGLLWRDPLPGPSTQALAVDEAHEAVFVAGGRTTSRVSLGAGEVEWARRRSASSRSAPLLRRLSGGRPALVMTTDAGEMLALAADAGGAQIWRTPLSGALTAPAADRQAAYVGIARADAGMIAAVRLEDGHLLWRVPVRGRPAAVSTVPGAVIVATSEGRLLALSADRGAVLWAAETARPYEAVNGAPAHGGAFGPAPLAAADGMIFAVSGYALAGGRAGNVLLAFAPE